MFFLKGDRIQYNAVTICAKVYDDVDDGRVLESKIILSQNITYFCYRVSQFCQKLKIQNHFIHKKVRLACIDF